MDVDSFPTFGSTTGTRVFDQLTESNPSPSRRNVEKVDFFAHQRQSVLMVSRSSFAVPSSGCCLVSLPLMAAWRIARSIALANSRSRYSLSLSQVQQVDQ